MAEWELIELERLGTKLCATENDRRHAQLESVMVMTEICGSCCLALGGT